MAKIRAKQIDLSFDNTLGGAAASDSALPSQKAIKEYVDANSDALHNLVATVDPTPTDDASDGYSEGSLWYNTVAGTLFVLVDPTVGAAQWVLYNDTSKVSLSNQDMPANTTTADGQLATNTTVLDAPLAGSNVQVHVNGVAVDVGAGLACYFSPDGVLVRSAGDVQQGDALYWNGSVAGYELVSGLYTIDFVYLVSGQADSSEARSGWALYVDSASVTTPQTIAAATPTKLTIDALGVGTDETYKPASWASLWNTATQKYEASHAGSIHHVRVSFNVNPLGATVVECWMDDGVTEWQRQVYNHNSGAGVEEPFSFGFMVPANANVMANGLEVVLFTDATVDVSDVRLVADFRRP